MDIDHLENTPWTVKQFQDAYAVVDSEGWVVGQWTSLEFARFIAAAPDLLAALEALLRQLKFAPPSQPEKVTIKSIHVLREAAEQARAALAAARGGATG